MSHSRLAQALIFLFVARVASAQLPPPSHGRIAAEIGAGFLGAPIGFAAGYLVGSGFRPHGENNFASVVGLAGLFAGTPFAVRAAGAGGPGQGSFGATVAGTAIGYAATLVLVPIATQSKGGKLKVIATGVAILMPAVGATIAYNRSRR